MGTRARLLRIMGILWEHSSEECPLRMADIMAHLSAYGIKADRKSVYDDIEALCFFGFDVIQCPIGTYFMASRVLDVPELKLIADAVRSAEFLTASKTDSILKKLESLTDRETAKLLHSTFATRHKTTNDGVCYSIDLFTLAIKDMENVRFKYIEYSPDKKKHLKDQGREYFVEPQTMVWDNQRYYLVGYDLNAKVLKHFRVDKVYKPALAGKGERDHKAFNTDTHLRQIFGMFSGPECSVKLRATTDLTGVMVDRFGENILINSGAKDGSMTFGVKIQVSPSFLGWVFGFGGKVQILEPESAKAQFNQTLQYFIGKGAVTK